MPFHPPSLPAQQALSVSSHASSSQQRPISHQASQTDPLSREQTTPVPLSRGESTLQLPPSAAAMATMAATVPASTQPAYLAHGGFPSSDSGMSAGGVSWAGSTQGGMPSSSSNAGYANVQQIGGQNAYSQFAPRRSNGENDFAMHGVQYGEGYDQPWGATRNLKRSGDESWEQQGQLRRPASFTAQQPGAPISHGEEARYAQQQNTGRPMPHKISTPLAGKSGLQEALVNQRQEQQYGYATNASPAQRGQILSRGEVTPAFSTISTLPSTSPGSSTHNRRDSAYNYGLPSEEAQYVENQYYPQKSSPAMYSDPNVAPQLMRATQVYAPAYASGASSHSHTMSMSSTSSSPPGGATSLGAMPHLSQRAHLELHGNVLDMALGWSHDEWRSRRRLVQFWRKQEGTKIHAICKPILPEQYVPNSVVVSCIFWDVTNECYITSVDVIYLLEALVASRFNVEEKNRIRRNLEGLKPKTISKQPKNVDENLNRIHDEFFKLVMSFPNPKPRHIEKDIKIFPWRTLPAALNKIISKYSAAPLMAVADNQPSSFTSVPHLGSANSTPMPSEIGSFSTPTPSNASSHWGQQTQQQQQQHQQQYMGGYAPQHHAQQSAPSYSGSSQQQSSPHGSAGSMRRLNPNLSIDISATNNPTVSGTPAGAPPSTSAGAAGIPGFVPLSARGLTSPAGNFLLPQPSPRRTPGMWGMSLSGGLGSSTFNINDFVVSPSAFAQTPLQQMHNIGSTSSASAGLGGAPASGGGAGSSATGASGSGASRDSEGGLGVNLGPYKQE